jgi:hypothetical protein
MWDGSTIIVSKLAAITPQRDDLEE